MVVVVSQLHSQDLRTVGDLTPNYELPILQVDVAKLQATDLAASATRADRYRGTPHSHLPVLVAFADSMIFITCSFVAHLPTRDFTCRSGL